MDRTWIWTSTRHTFLSLKVITHARYRIISGSSHFYQDSAPIFNSSSDRQGAPRLTAVQGTTWLCSEGSWLQVPHGRDWVKGRELQHSWSKDQSAHNRQLWSPCHLLKLKQLFALLGRLVRSFVKTHWLLQKRSSPFQYGPSSPFQYGPGFLSFLYKWSIFMNPSIFHLLSDGKYWWKSHNFYI